MIWALLALLAAITVASSDAVSKHVLKTEDEYLVVLAKFGFAAIFLAPLLLLVEIPALGLEFWRTVIILLPLEITATVLYIKAIKVSPLSLTIPFLAFTPVFLVLTGFLILGEFPSRIGLIGIVLVSTGAYILNMDKRKDGLLAPIKAIVKEKGSVLMLGTALIYSVTSALGKKAVLLSSPWFFAGFYVPFVSIFVLGVVTAKRGRKVMRILKDKYFVLIGFFIAISAIGHWLAVSMIDVAYMISVKRTSMVFAVIYGALLFKEKRLKERLVGSIVMVLGVVFIVFQ